MRSLTMAAAILAAAFTWTSIDLGACGDKFTRIGQSTRLRGYAAIHPASILVYKPAKSNAAGVNFYKSLLSGAGHKPSFVDYGTPLDKALAKGKFDLILVHYADLPLVAVQLRNLPAGRPDVVPILDKASAANAMQAQKDCQFLILPERMTAFEALNEIDHAMDHRLTGTVAPLPGTH